jgi:HEPN domain-containing protein
MRDIRHARLMLGMAQLDLQAVSNMRDPQRFADSIFGFHVQQAAEKLLKAWLSVAGTAYPRTHDLRLLLALVAEQDSTDIAAFQDLEDLTDYGVQFRYDAPFDLEPLDRIALIAHIEALHRLVTERLDSADPPAYAG